MYNWNAKKSKTRGKNNMKTDNNPAIVSTIDLVLATRKLEQRENHKANFDAVHFKNFTQFSDNS